MGDLTLADLLQGRHMGAIDFSPRGALARAVRPPPDDVVHDASGRRYEVEQYRGGPDPLSLLGLRFGFGRLLQPRHTLSENQTPQDPDLPAHIARYFRYNILRDGDHVGDVRGLIPPRAGPWGMGYGDSANITGFWGGGNYGPNSLGPGALRQLREAFRRDFPEVTRFEGLRQSGARVRERRRPVVQRVDMP